jgi:primosomal protein N' (replication factor Y)
VLVPEIALTPVVTSIFRERFGDRVAIQRSGSRWKRHDQWQRIRRGDVDVVIGTRSAVFARSNVGLIVVDEEHDGSCRRRAALQRPRRGDRPRTARRRALVVLGSATPSLESYHNATSGRCDALSSNAGCSIVRSPPSPSWTCVRIRQPRSGRHPQPVAWRRLERARREKEQALVLLNRRGFATAIFCRQCAGTMDCPIAVCRSSCTAKEAVAARDADTATTRCGAWGLPALRRPVSRAGWLRHWRASRRK